jgi:hypothetical protein
MLFAKKYSTSSKSTKDKELLHILSKKRFDKDFNYEIDVDYTIMIDTSRVYERDYDKMKKSIGGDINYNLYYVIFEHTKKFQILLKNEPTSNNDRPTDNKDKTIITKRKEVYETLIVGYSNEGNIYIPNVAENIQEFNDQFIAMLDFMQSEVYSIKLFKTPNRFNPNLVFNDIYIPPLYQNDKNYQLRQEFLSDLFAFGTEETKRNNLYSNDIGPVFQKYPYSDFVKIPKPHVK